jgi:hypothetical protein
MKITAAKIRDALIKHFGPKGIENTMNKLKDRLRDNRGASERFVATIDKAARDLSLFFAGHPDSQAIATLDGYVSRVRPAIENALGIDRADELLKRFSSDVMAGKRSMEGKGISRA